MRCCSSLHAFQAAVKWLRQKVNLVNNKPVLANLFTAVPPHQIERSRINHYNFINKRSGRFGERMMSPPTFEAMPEVDMLAYNRISNSWHTCARTSDFAADNGDENRLTIVWLIDTMFHNMIRIVKVICISSALFIYRCRNEQSNDRGYDNAIK